MQIILVGLTYHTAPVTIRERVALTSSESIDLLKLLSQPLALRPAVVAEAAILSTCNRFEVYGVAPDDEPVDRELGELLAKFRCLAPQELAPYLLYMHAERAVRHLFTVAAGLDSMILGEPQILGQVSQAYEAALGCGAAGSVLGALFRQAIRCGKRARTETAIGEHAASVSHAAVELARQIFGSLGERRVLVVGAGEMAELAARNLRDNGAGRILVVNRSRGRAEALARQLDGLAYGWEDLDKALGQADVVICSAAAPHTIIHPGAVRSALARRQQQPLFLIDIAVPRNVEPAVGKLADVYLYDIDDLRSVVQDNLAQRQREVPMVEAIVEQCSAEYMAWFHGLDVSTTIRDLRSAAEQLRDDEIARALRRLGPLNEHQERVVRTMAHNIVSKLLHSPTVRLKQLAREGNGYHSADVLRDLFGLSGSCSEEGHR